MAVKVWTKVVSGYICFPAPFSSIAGRLLNLSAYLFQATILFWLTNPILWLVKQGFLEFIFRKVFFLRVAIRKFLRRDRVRNRPPQFVLKTFKQYLYCHRSWNFLLKMCLFLCWRLPKNQRPCIKLLLASCHGTRGCRIEFSLEFCPSFLVQMPLTCFSTSLSLSTTSIAVCLVFWFWSTVHTAPRNILKIKPYYVTSWLKNLHCSECLLEINPVSLAGR